FDHDAHASFCNRCGVSLTESTTTARTPVPVLPTSFAASGHHLVRRLLGEGSLGSLQVRRLIVAGHLAEAQALANAKLMAKPLQQMSYQPVGDLLINLPTISADSATDYERALDLDSALAVTRFTAGTVRYERRVFACPVHQVLAVRLTASKPGAVDCDVSLDSPQSATLELDGDMLTLAGRNPGEQGIAGALRFVARARVLREGGTLEARAAGVGVRGADAVTILIAMATSYRRFNDTSGDPDAITRAQIAAAAARGFADIFAAGVADHRRLYRSVRLDLGRTASADRPTDERIRTSEDSDDPALAALYFNYGRYLLIASSRAGSQPANLQGIWNDHVRPPWGSKYTININTEMNYWPAEPTALAECTAPLITFVRDLAEQGAHTAREMYGARGWVAHHNTDLWRATAPIDGASWGLWPTGGAWLCTHLWDRWDYGRDRDYLASVYPLMRGAALFDWDDSMQLDRTSGRFAMDRNVHVSHKRAADGGVLYLVCDSLTGTARVADGQSDRGMNTIGDLEFVDAVGAVYARWDGRELLCDRIHYNALAGTVRAESNQSSRITLVDPARAAVIHAQAATWNLDTGEAQLEGTQPVVVPVGPLPADGGG
ncbi:MAG: glycoside hydrolase family 95 protein, partial [Planctomycetes bacterium]|nr:glycoside hydrolase family 95 protein [Planctomycetota bacterium]